MSSINIRSLKKSYGSFVALQNINLAVDDAELLVLVGPSGCGKSTLLGLIAGLDTTTSGHIEIRGEDVTKKHPRDRDIAMVFQSYALYPTMTVRQNISFGLEMRGVVKEQRERSITDVAELLQIVPLLDRKPSELSGGQRQRVAMGRALVRRPEVFLLDEPLSNLDAKLRIEMRTEIKKLHARLGKTMIYVTHDQIEAMTLATRIAVMKDGVIQQLDAPRTVYDDPANLFVAEFIGSPSMNFIPVQAVSSQGGVDLTTGGDQASQIHLSVDLPLANGRQSLVLGVRPEDVRLVTPDNPPRSDECTLPAVIDIIEPTGAEDLVAMNVANVTMQCTERDARDRVPGQSVQIAFAQQKCLYFDPDSGRRLRSTASLRRSA